MSTTLIPPPEELPFDEEDVRFFSEPAPLPEDTVEEEVLDVELDPGTAQWLDDVVMRCLIFLEELCDIRLYPYQQEVAYRILESLILGDGEEVTVLQARQSGKSESVTDVFATAMVILPRLAVAFPEYEPLQKFRKGVLIGVFAPTDGQADTIWGRIVTRLTSEAATNLMLDPEIDDETGKAKEKAKTITLRRSGSLCRQQTAHPKAKIESKSYHVLVVDECQDADDFVVRKSIHPMLAFYNGTMVKTGTCNRVKNDFYKACQRNKRRSLRRGARRNHFEYDYKVVCKYNNNYKAFIAKEKHRIGEDSDEFQLSYALRWLLDRGMFTTEDKLFQLMDPSMRVVREWWKTSCVVGVDPARTTDSTVVTVCWVDWDHPDEFGLREIRVLNWLEINNEEWENQYFEITRFLSNYRVSHMAVDANGMGSAVAERLALLLPYVEVFALQSGDKSQSERWTHLTSLMQRELIIFPGHSKARALKVHKKFVQQMTDAEKVYRGQYLLVRAPDDEKDAHDDYVDSLALAASCTLAESVPEVEQVDSPFVARRG